VAVSRQLQLRVRARVVCRARAAVIFSIVRRSSQFGETMVEAVCCNDLGPLLLEGSCDRNRKKLYSRRLNIPRSRWFTQARLLPCHRAGSIADSMSVLRLSCHTLQRLLIINSNASQTSSWLIVLNVLARGHYITLHNQLESICPERRTCLDVKNRARVAGWGNTFSSNCSSALVSRPPTTTSFHCLANCVICTEF
jgi:hypothetical protein